MFSAASVGVTPSGNINNLPYGSMLRPANSLPVSPDWAWEPGDPEATGSTGGWAIGNDLERNKEFADKSGAVASLAQEGHNWISTFKDRVPVWEAYDELRTNINSFSKATSVVSTFGLPEQRTNLVNFINDGSLPGLDLKNLSGSLQKVVGIMQAGMELMKKNNIKIKATTMEKYESYKAALDFLKGSQNKSKRKLD